MGRRVGLEKGPVVIPRQISACLLSGRNEWACDMGSNAMASISMPLEWDLLSMHGMCGQAMLNLWQVSVCLQHRRESCPEPTQVVRPLELFYRDGTTSGRVTAQV